MIQHQFESIFNIKRKLLTGIVFTLAERKVFNIIPISETRFVCTKDGKESGVDVEEGGDTIE